MSLSASVVVSCFNQENYITQCIDSILSQDVDFDYELIVSDDASTDQTPLILKDMEKKCSKDIALVLRTENVGPAKNYIDLHNAAVGEFVFHMDGDDVMLPGKMQKQFNAFKNNGLVNVVMHRAEYFSDDMSYLSTTQYPEVYEDVYFSSRDLACWGSIAVHSSYAYRRSSRQERVMDREFMEWYFAMDSLIPEGLGVMLSDVLVKYRCNVGGTTYLSSFKGVKKAYGIYLNDLNIMYNKHPFLRRQIYANSLVTQLAMARGIGRVSLKSLKFLIINIRFLSWKLLKKSFKVRRLVGPAVTAKK